MGSGEGAERGRGGRVGAMGGAMTSGALNGNCGKSSVAPSEA